ncbi:YbaK/EbsC family protein [Sphingobium phenoxybenzoativorans]|uniref:YbaK/EbsC family protein n=1 Tax=Sphingobium phenoxybenzoativorans TaxID=1592790 RepID=UPI0008722109|nr:YbaK/EbsC family protein [Sphingobium phenoxybenzoativorans]
MSLESVQSFLARSAPELAIIDQGASTATVAEAAMALGVEPARIAKTLSLKVGDETLLVVARGDTRLDNRKTRDALGGKPRMLDADTVMALTGHPVGGVCPFGLATPLPVYCDISLRAFTSVFPAAGSRTASVEVTPDRLAEITNAQWVDVCTLPPAGGDAG